MKRYLCLGLICGVLLWSGSAWALTAWSTSHLLWDTLSISENPEESVTVDSFQYTNLAASVATSSSGTITNDPDPSYDDQNASAYVLPFAESHADSTLSMLSVYAMANADGINNTWAEASADLHRVGDFYVDLEGASELTLAFSMEYYLGYEISFGGIEGEEGTIYNSFIAFTITKDSQEYDFARFSEISEPDGGILTFETTFYETGLYGLDVHMLSSVYAFTPSNDINPGQTAPVPEPSTMVLMGLGLMGLAGMGRKRLKN